MLDAGAIALEDQDLPTPVAALLMQAAMEERPLAECLEQKIAFIRSDLDDLMKLRLHSKTADLFEAEEGNLWSMLSTVQLLVSDVRVHDRPSPAVQSVRSPALRVVAGGA
jgi:hypothetical protein